MQIADQPALPFGAEITSQIRVVRIKQQHARRKGQTPPDGISGIQGKRHRCCNIRIIRLRHARLVSMNSLKVSGTFIQGNNKSRAPSSRQIVMAHKEAKPVAAKK